MHFVILFLFAALVAAQGYDPICGSEKAFAACCDQELATDERYCKIYEPSQITPADWEPRLEFFRGVCEQTSRSPRCCRLDGFNGGLGVFDLSCNLSEDEVGDGQVCFDQQLDALCCPSEVPASKTTIREGTTCEPAEPTPTVSESFADACAADDDNVPRCCSSTTTTYTSPTLTVATITTCNGPPPVAPTEPVISTPDPTLTPTPTPTSPAVSLCPQNRRPRCCNANKLLILNTDCQAPNPTPTDLVEFFETCLAGFKTAKCCPLELLGLGVACNNPPQSSQQPFTRI